MQLNGMREPCSCDLDIFRLEFDAEELAGFEDGGFAGAARTREWIEDGVAGAGDEFDEVAHQGGGFDGWVMVAALDDAVQADVLALVVAFAVELGAVGHARFDGWHGFAPFVPVLFRGFCAVEEAGGGTFTCFLL